MAVLFGTSRASGKQVAFGIVFCSFNGYRSDDTVALHAYGAKIFLLLERQNKKVFKIIFRQSCSEYNKPSQFGEGFAINKTISM